MKTHYKWLLSVFCLLAIQVAFGQSKTLIGIVSEDGLPLPGVSVTIEGTNLGTQTSLDGEYSIQVQQGQSVVFSFLGMDKVVHKVGAEAVHNVQMSALATELDNIVVVAYGTQSKSSIAGSIATIGAKDIENGVASDVTQGLVGKVPGVQIMATSGAPGQSPVIRFRGIGSISASASPLIVLDGVPFNGGLNSINNADIESISFLKDASSAALYGNRGANGVIIITTKKGNNGDLKVSFQTKIGIADKNYRSYDKITDPKEYYQAYHNLLRGTYSRSEKLSWTDAGQRASNNLIGINGSLTSLGAGLGYNIYDVGNTELVDANGRFNPNAKLRFHDKWDDYTYRNGVVNSNYLSVSGGTDRTKFFLSIGYDTNEGIVNTQSFDKTMVRLNMDAKINKTFEVGGNVSYANMVSNSPMGGGYATGSSSFSDIFMWTNSIAPIYPVFAYDADGERILDVNGQAIYDDGRGLISPYIRPWGSNGNPVGEGNLNFRKSTVHELFATGFLGINITDNLKFKYVLSGDLYNSVFRSTMNPIIGPGVGAKGRVYQDDSTTFALTNQQLLSYNKWFGDHNIDVILGHETLQRNNDFLGAQRTNLAFVDSPYLNHGSAIVAAGGGNSEYILEGYFARLNYGYDNKYFLNASIRRDASSYFAPENRWGTFFGVGGAWVMSQENFLSSVSWLNNLKLKASYGEQGNDNLGMVNPYQDSWSIAPSFDGNAPIQMSRNRIGNRDVTWEVNKNLNAGFELSVFNNRISLEAEYFERNVDDMLFLVPQPLITGVPTKPYNAGDMTNKGFEVSLDADIVRKQDFNIALNLNVSHYKNKLTRLPEGIDEIIAGQFRRVVGKSVFNYHLKEYVGVNKENGNAQFIRIDPSTGERSIVENLNDATFQDTGKTSIPKIYGGFGLNVDYKNFDLSMQFAYQLGGYGLDSSYYSYFSPDAGTNSHKDWKNTWTPDNMNADMPAMYRADANRAYGQSTMYLIKSDYLSIQNITLGYSFKPTVLNSIGLDNLRIYALVDNPVIWSKRKGYDPRLHLSGLSGSGYNLYSTYMFGVNLQF